MIQVSGTSRLRSGTRMASAASSARKTVAPRSSERRTSSCLDRPALEREQAARTLLDEQDDEHQDADLAEHGARERLEELVGDAEREGADQRAPQVSDAAEHHHHEAVDDVALAEIGTHIVDLRQRHPGDAGDAGAEP